MKLPSNTAIIVGGVAVVGLLAYFFAKKAGQVLATDLNPTSDQNLAYRGVNGVGASLTGDKNFSLGSYIYDLFHTEYDPNAPTSSAAKGNTGIFASSNPAPYNPASPGDIRTEYVTAAPGIAPNTANEFSLNKYLYGGGFPTLGGGIQSTERANGSVI